MYQRLVDVHCTGLRIDFRHFWFIAMIQENFNHCMCIIIT